MENTKQSREEEAVSESVSAFSNSEEETTAMPEAEEASEDTAVSETGAETIDWKSRYESAERSLQDALDFAALYAPYAESKEDLRTSGVYTRFCELRALGLSLEEAFSAVVRSERAPTQVGATALSPASKQHLTSTVPKGFGGAVRLSGEELAVARELLGDTYSGEELAKLYRRVAKS